MKLTDKDLYITCIWVPLMQAIDERGVHISKQYGLHKILVHSKVKDTLS